MFIVRLLFLFVIIHVYHHLLFDEFAPSVAKMKKFWAKHRVFVPASAHQLISSKKQPHVVSVDDFLATLIFACICHLVMKCCKLFSN